MLFGWEYSKDFLEEATLFKRNLDVRVKFGQEGLLVGDGGRVTVFQVAVSGISWNRMELLIFYWFYLRSH